MKLRFSVFYRSPAFSLSNSPGEQNKKKRKLLDFSLEFDNIGNKFSSPDTSQTTSAVFDIIEDGVNEKEIDLVSYPIFCFLLYLDKSLEKYGTHL